MGTRIVAGATRSALHWSAPHPRGNRGGLRTSLAVQEHGRQAACPSRCRDRPLEGCSCDWVRGSMQVRVGDRVRHATDQICGCFSFYGRPDRNVRVHRGWMGGGTQSRSFEAHRLSGRSEHAENQDFRAGWREKCGSNRSGPIDRSADRFSELRGALNFCSAIWKKHNAWKGVWRFQDFVGRRFCASEAGEGSQAGE